MSLDEVFEELEEGTEEKAKKPTETTEVEEDREPTPEEQPPVEASVESTDIWGEPITTPAPPTETPPEVESKEIPVESLTEETPIETPPPPPAIEEFFETTKTKVKEDYDLSPDSGSPKIVHVPYGLKGEGKTGLALSYPGKICALSFDRKTVKVWIEMYNSDPRITVFDAVRYLDKASAVQWIKTADVTLEYLNALLDTKITKLEPDWILIDGVEIFTQISEMSMRYRNGLQPFQGIANRNLWKERRMIIDQLHNKCISIAKRGVIYTTYTRKEEIIKDGQPINSKDVPKWIDAVMYYADVVIRVRSRQGETGRVFTAEVESSKTKEIKTGLSVDITGTTGYDALIQKGD